MKKHLSILAATTATLGLFSGLALADEERSSDGAALRAIEKCLSVEDSAARLACFEKASAAFDFESAVALLNQAAALKKEAAIAKAAAAEQKAKADALIKANAAAKAEAEKAQAEARTKSEALAKAVAAEKERAEKLAAEAAAEKAKAEALERAKAAEEERMANLRVDEFGKKDAQVKTVKSIETTIKEIIRPKRGGIVFVFDNGQVWRQADGDHPGRIKNGMKVRIRRTTMGGYVMTIEISRKSLRVKRIN